MNKNKGFTLIELLIAIGIIAILSAVVIVAINPGQQFAAARDSVRDSDTSSIYQSLLSYRVSRAGGFPDIDLPSESKEICNTNHFDSEDCAENDLVDLSPLVPDYMNDIPIDPIAEQDELSTGYEIAINTINDVIVCAPLAETREVGVCETERRENDFACGDVLVDSRDGESYDTVMIGEQCWMAEDLRHECENYVDTGDSTESPEGWWDEEEDPTMCSDANDGTNDYGNVLYQWPAAVAWGYEGDPPEEGVQGLCPDGWYIPTDSDWEDLKSWLLDNGYEIDDSGEVYSNALKDPQEDWCTEEGSEFCGEIDFLALPGGYQGVDWSDFSYKLNRVGTHGHWWSSSIDPESEDGDIEIKGRFFSHDHTSVGDFVFSDRVGASVRCIKE